LPAGTTLRISFPLGYNDASEMGIQLWDPNGEEWVSLIDLITTDASLEAYVDWPGTSLLVE
jgi:hypothetical protein